MDHHFTFKIPGVPDPEGILELCLKALRGAGYEPEVERRVTEVVITGRPPNRADDETTYAVKAAFLNGVVNRPDHTSGLFRQRPAGSQWGRYVPPNPDAWAALAWREVPHDQLPPRAANPTCRYFKTNDPALLDGAVEHVGLSTDIPRGQVFSSRGPHGWQLVTATELPRRCATEAWLVLGPAGRDAGLIPWTAFPGRMAAAPPPDWDGDLSKLNLEEVPYGVKYVSPETVRLAT